MPIAPHFCFACAPRSATEALHDRSPGGLCLDHKRRCKLPDGTSLLDTLACATPQDGQLEGSQLAYIYNPVFVVGASGQTQRGWTDFAAGGMAVLEDRFGAANRFENWALELDSLHALWRPLLEVHARDGTSTDLRALAVTLDSRGPERGLAWLNWFLFRRGQDVKELRWESMQFCLAAALSNWRLHRHVEERRARAGSPWPSSFADLQVWLQMEPYDFLLPFHWTTDPNCVPFTRDMVGLASRWVSSPMAAV